MLENLASFDAENEPCIFKERPKQMYASWFKKRKIEKKNTHTLCRSRLEKGWASDLQKPLSSLSQPSFFFTLLLSVSLPYLLKPSNYSNEWLRARERRRQREAVRDWEDRWWGDKSGREWKEEIHHSFLSAWVPVIHWPCADWSVKINSRDQMSRPALLSVVVLTSWGLMWGQVGMCIKMKMPVWGYSYPKDLFFAAVRDANCMQRF